jgi:hypothetical protein
MVCNSMMFVLFAAQESGQSSGGFAMYLIIAGVGVAVAVLGLVLRKPLEGQGALPGWLVGGIAGVAIGAGVGCGLMHTMGYRWSPQPIVIQQQTGTPMGGIMGGQGGANMPASPPGPGAGMAPPGGGRGPATKGADATKGATDKSDGGAEK